MRTIEEGPSTTLCTEEDLSLRRLDVIHRHDSLHYLKIVSEFVALGGEACLVDGVMVMGTDYGDLRSAALVCDGAALPFTRTATSRESALAMFPLRNIFGSMV